MSYKIGEYADTAMSMLNELFKGYEHKHSEEMRADALGSFELFEGIMLDAASPSVFLNTMATGVGKTSIGSVGIVVAWYMHRDKGVLMCVPLLREIEDLIQTVTNLGLPKEQIYVHTADDKANALGGATDGNKAFLCITTQQMIDKRLAGTKQLSDLDIFHYNGGLRKLRLWDESLLPWEELLINVDQIAKLPGFFRNWNTHLADELLDIVERVRKLDSGSLYEFPDLAEKYQLDYKKLRYDTGTEGIDTRKAVRSLCKISGKPCRISQDEFKRTIIDWSDNLPEDFFPVVVFDASGRVRSAYEHFKKASGVLEVYTKSQKDFSNVTFHHVPIASGRNKWRGYKDRLLTATAFCINADDRKPLVVGFKPDDDNGNEKDKIPDIKEALVGNNYTNKDFSYVSWGNHKQTNEYRDYTKMVLSGMPYLPYAVIELRTRGALGLSAKEELSYDAFRDIEIGELKNDLLQAVGRICVRKIIDGNKCPEADVFIIAGNRSGADIQKLLAETFPGSKYRRFHVDDTTKEKWELVIEYLVARLSDISSDAVSFGEVMDCVGIANRANFNKLIRSNPEFKKAIADMGIYEISEGRYPSHFKRSLMLAETIAIS